MEKQHPTSCSIGAGIQIRGSLSGSGDLNVHGRVEGQVDLEDHLTVELTGVIVANTRARQVTVYGNVQGDTEAAEAVALRASASYSGNIDTKQNFTMEDGARFNGHITMVVPLPDDLKRERERR